MQVAVLLVGWGWSTDQLRDGWLEVEDLGFDICYVGDDLFAHQAEVDVAVYETWTTLAAIATTTSRIRIGSLVSPAGRRHPVLLAKMATTVDRLSGGRLIVGRGLGNAPEQQASLGQPFGPPAERAAMLAEELEIMRSLWSRRRTTFAGEHFRVENAINEPKPFREGGPELLVAFASPRFGPALAARFADRANLLGGDDAGIRKAVARFDRECRALGRDPNELTLGRLASVIFTDGKAAHRDRETAIADRAREIGADPTVLIAEHGRRISFVGPPDRCGAELMRRTRPFGIEEVVISIDTVDMNSYDRTMSGLRTFAAEVLPELRA